MSRADSMETQLCSLARLNLSATVEYDDAMRALAEAVLDVFIGDAAALRALGLAKACERALDAEGLHVLMGEAYGKACEDYGSPV